jgi:outer membrane lipoprotein-sorting protein
MSVLSARRGWFRIVPPLLVAALVAGGVAFASASRSEGAPPSLPSRTPEQLLADVSQANVPGLSGTVVETARLGLPELPATGGSAGGNGGASIAGLVTGSHTIRVYLKGQDKSRAAITGPLSESDVIHNGRDLWLYSSDQNAVTHFRSNGNNGPTGSAPETPAPGNAPVTPQQAAHMVIQAITPTTQVQVERNLRVAGRDAYQLRLRPKDPGSLIDSVVLAVDGATKVPLRVQVLAKGKQDPAFEVGFTQVQFRAPSDDVFDFTPPPGAKVTEGKLPGHAGNGQAAPKPNAGATPNPDAAEAPRVIGEGWTAVLVLPNGGTLGNGGPGGSPAPNGSSGSEGSAPNGPNASKSPNGTPNQSELLAQLLRTATPVHGAFGSGRLLRTTLVTVLLTDNGRLYAGAVTPEAIQAAAAKPLPAPEAPRIGNR